MGIRIGGRIGPVSASTNGRGCGWIFLAIAAIAFVGWPFVAGRWVAEKLGGGPDLQNVIGWVLEIPWAILLIVGYIGWQSGKKRR